MLALFFYVIFNPSSMKTLILPLEQQGHSCLSSSVLKVLVSVKGLKLFPLSSPQGMLSSELFPLWTQHRIITREAKVVILGDDRMILKARHRLHCRISKFGAPLYNSIEDISSMEDWYNYIFINRKEYIKQ